MALSLTGYRLHPVHLPYRRRVTWAGHAEGGVDALILVLETAGGVEGVGEVPVRPNWTGHNLASLTAILEQVFLPRLTGADLSDEKAVARIVHRVPEHSIAKALIDIAVCDVRAQSAHQSLWRWLGGGDARVRVCATLTRGGPADMARDAEALARDTGMAAFKVKTGQGMETDRAVLQAVRSAIGDGALVFADANRAYTADEVATYTTLLFEHGAIAAEDPCELVPDATLADVNAGARIPVLVDHGCRNLAQAKLFLGAGAQALSVKVMKSGLTESLAIARAAAEAASRAHVGIGATGRLGAYAALSLSSALDGWLPCEECFFVNVTDDIVTEPLEIRNGAVTLPDAGSLGALIDWRKVDALRP